MVSRLTRTAALFLIALCVLLVPAAGAVTYTQISPSANGILNYVSTLNMTDLQEGAYEVRPVQRANLFRIPVSGETTIVTRAMNDCSQFLERREFTVTPMPEDSKWSTVQIIGPGERTAYTITVNGTIENEYDGDRVDGNTAEGAVGGGVDMYRYTGSIEDVYLSNSDAVVRVNETGLNVTTTSYTSCPEMLGGNRIKTDKDLYLLYRMRTYEPLRFKVDIIDDEPPTVNVTHSPTALLDNETVTYTASATDNYGIANLSIQVDGAAVKTCQSSSCTYTSGPYAEGSTHTYQAIATDIDGNEAITPERQFRVTPVSCPYPFQNYKTVPAILQGICEDGTRIHNFFDDLKQYINGKITVLGEQISLLEQGQVENAENITDNQQALRQMQEQISQLKNNLQSNASRIQELESNVSQLKGNLRGNVTKVKALEENVSQLQDRVDNLTVYETAKTQKSKGPQ